MNQLYRLDQYLNSHKVEKQKVREALDFRKGDSLYVNVYSSFEINFRGLQGKGNIKTDRAIQLLQMFTFSHRENILKDFLTNAAANPEVERREQEREKTRRVANQASQVRLSWSNMIKHIMLKVVLFFYKDRTPPVLPGFIRDSVASNDEEYRLNEALNELTQLSLLNYNEVNDSYSMHPVVHTWGRERPEFHAIEQAVWCQAAMTALAQCILLPPLGFTEADEQLRRDHLPHIDHVGERQNEIEPRIWKNQQRCETAWLHSPAPATRTQIGQMAGLSRLYAQVGKWDKALKLQLALKDFCLKTLGPNHTSTMLIKVALSGTYWQLGQGNEAAQLQEQVLNAYTASLGEKDKRTLEPMDFLGRKPVATGMIYGLLFSP